MKGVSQTLHKELLSQDMEADIMGHTVHFIKKTYRPAENDILVLIKPPINAFADIFQ